ncbi:low temperature requirement protein A [Salinicola corii]|uniref:Low temperature requirement protein A n=2 Tax=Salinicola corii TaxID=2606937 RepID=A0A640WFI8_9GAMM|nr:low temperature requirement protein A [Salinicola corii]
MRRRGGGEAPVRYVELLFDLVYVFAIIQLSHFLLANLTLLGAAQTLLLWFAVWLGWQYTGWVTNWFEPDAPAIRLLLLLTMALALAMSAALPEAFGDRGLAFALCFVAMQVGRATWIWSRLAGHPLRSNYSRILGWALIAAVLWIIGGMLEGTARLALWLLAVLCDYVSPMFGFPLPGLGRSDSQRDWDIEGGHLVERCALFMLIALGETILITGGALTHSDWHPATLAAAATAFLVTVSMWGVYFHIAIHDASAAIRRVSDPGRMGARFHYIHALILASVIATAVGIELVVAHPFGHLEPPARIVLTAAPVLFLAAMTIYKAQVYGRPPLSHLVGIVLLPAIALSLLPWHDALPVLLGNALVLASVSVWERMSRRGVIAW